MTHSKQLIQFPGVERLLEAFAGYGAGASISLHTQDGDEDVQIRGGVWMDERIVFQGVVRGDAEYRNIDLGSMRRQQDTIEKSRDLLSLMDEQERKTKEWGEAIGLLDPPTFEQFLFAFYRRGTLTLIRAVGTLIQSEEVLLVGGVWTGGVISFQGIVGDDGQTPFRNIHLGEMDSLNGSPTWVEKSREPLRFVKEEAFSFQTLEDSAWRSGDAYAMSILYSQNGGVQAYTNLSEQEVKALAEQAWEQKARELGKEHEASYKEWWIAGFYSPQTN